MRNDSEGSSQPPLEARLLRAIAAEAIAACDPAPAVARAVSMGSDRLSVAGQAIGMQRKGRLLILAYGKAAPRMLDGLLGRLAEAGGRRIVEALSIEPRPGSPRSGTTAHGTMARRPGRAPGPGAAIRLARLRGDHPVPKAASFAAGRRALRLATSARAADDVIFLASGGGSALMAAPLEPFMTPADKTLLHRMLLVSGAPIGTINAVRKHLSAIKGGRLAVAARRARSRTTLVLCDVDPERHDEVASGPSLPDRTTLDDVIMAIDRYGLAPALPFPVLDGLRDGRIPETPTPRDAIVRRSGSAIVLSNRDLRNAAVRAGLSRGLSAEAVPIDLTGPVEEAMERMARAIETAPQGTRLLVLGGEVTT